MAFRFTKKTIPAVLEKNDGLKFSTYYSGKNGSRTNSYRIENGKVFWKQSGKTSWADSRYENDWSELDENSVHRLLRNHKNELILPE